MVLNNISPNNSSKNNFLFMFTIYHIAFTDFPCVVWASVKDDRHDGENPFIIIVNLISIWADAHNLSQGTFTHNWIHMHTHILRGSCNVWLAVFQRPRGGFRVEWVSSWDGCSLWVNWKTLLSWSNPLKHTQKQTHTGWLKLAICKAENVSSRERQQERRCGEDDLISALD